VARPGLLVLYSYPVDPASSHMLVSKIKPKNRKSKNLRKSGREPAGFRVASTASEASLCHRDVPRSVEGPTPGWSQFVAGEEGESGSV
jgi:hypothetical protein